MIKILFVKEESDIEIVKLIQDTIESKFDIIEREQLNEYKDHEFYYNIVYDENDFFIGVDISTFNNISSVMLELDVDRTLDIKSEVISKFKINVKCEMMKIMDKCYWIEDEQMISFSTESYANINKAENMFRRFILNYMIHTYGGNWISSIAKDLGRQKSENSKAYNDSIKELNDVNMDLYSFYINDLRNLVENEYKIKADIVINTRKELIDLDRDKFRVIKNFIKQNMSTISNDSIDITDVKSNMFWNDCIGKYFRNSEEFKVKWERLCINRNHVAHNKPIDRNMYNIINEDTQYIIDSIDYAIQQLYNSIESEEDKLYYQKWDSAIRIEDLSILGANVYNEGSIEYELEEYFEGYRDLIEDILYFTNESFEYEINRFKLINNNSIITIKNIDKDESLSVYVRYFDLDESEGGTSTVGIGITGIEKDYEIIIENAIAEIDQDTGMYIPYTQGGIDYSGLTYYNIDKEDNEDIIIKSIKKFINR